MAKLSVIIPIYNVERYLAQCVESVLGQTLTDLEVILVDDQSPDRCPQLCDDYARRDSRVRVVHKKNAGQGLARNAGLDIARGEYVAFVDSDDYLDLNAYATAVAMADHHHLDTLRFKSDRFCDGETPPPVKSDCPLTIYDTIAQIRHLALTLFDYNEHPKGDATFGSICTAIFRRSVIEANHLRLLSEREYVSEDAIFSFHFFQHARRVGSLPAAFYHYRVNPMSFSHTLGNYSIEFVERYARYAEKLIEDAGYPAESRRYAQAYFIANSRVATRMMFLSPASLGEKRRWFMAHTRLDYFREVARTFPFRTLPVKHRLCWWAIYHRQFWVAYVLIVGFVSLARRTRA